MSWIHWAIDVLFHLNAYLDKAATHMGPRLYLLLFAIVFCETGLVVTPFLPGDSLLFAVGALAAGGTAIKLPVAMVVLCLAANCGDAVNYFLGYRLGPKVFSRESSWLLNKKHLLEAQNFYERHGGMTIILARFVPIIRTFAVRRGGGADAVCQVRGLQRERRHPVGRFGDLGRVLLRRDRVRQEEL